MYNIFPENNIENQILSYKQKKNNTQFSKSMHRYRLRLYTLYIFNEHFVGFELLFYNIIFADSSGVNLQSFGVFD